jgi:nucleotide-binding universal stress UspA family protein
MVYHKILIAVDSSEYSYFAAQKGYELSQKLACKSALIYVIDTSKAMGSVDAGILPDEALIILKKEAEQTFDQISKIWHKNKPERFMPEGHPVEEILKTTQAWQADLLVLGTHGRTGLRHLLMGNVAENIIRHSAIPVMVVPLKKL